MRRPILLECSKTAQQTVLAVPRMSVTSAIVAHHWPSGDAVVALGHELCIMKLVSHLAHCVSETLILILAAGMSMIKISAFGAGETMLRTTTGLHPHAKPMSAPHLGRLSEEITGSDFRLSE